MNDPTNLNDTVTQIAQALNETNTDLMSRVVAHIGSERALEFFQNTQQIEAGEGMLTEDHKRRRTPGGVFFYLVKQSLPAEDRQVLWPPQAKKKKTSGPPGEAQPAPQPKTRPTWDQTKEVIVTAFKSAFGEARTVKITLIGKPAAIQMKDSYVVFTLKGKEAPALPSGLPAAVNLKTPVYAVLVAMKQWRKVEESIKSNPNDKLIIEGWPTIDPQKGISIVWALSCKSMAMERAGRDTKK